MDLNKDLLMELLSEAKSESITLNSKSKSNSLQLKWVIKGHSAERSIKEFPSGVLQD